MAAPAFVFCDSDAVIQFLLVNQVHPFRVLRDRYKVQPVLVPEVELELQSHRKFGPRIRPGLKKAIDSGLFRVLDQALLEKHFGEPPANRLAAENALRSIAHLGAEYNRYVDTDESYTHAAAVTLAAPSLSHDGTALSALRNSGYDLPITVLRAFDLMCLCFQVKELTDRQCDDFRSALLREGERLPPEFRASCFTAGLANFTPRISDFKAPDVGHRDPLASGFAKVIIL